MKPIRITLLFEYATLNGGERSMLTVLDRLRRGFTFHAIAPATGPLADELRSREITVHPLKLRDRRGVQLPRDVVLRNLRDALHQSPAGLVHANSLAMGRLTGSLADEISIPCVAHLRDIIGLSNAALADLNRNHSLLAVSKATREFHIAQGLDSTKCRVLLNGVDLAEFQPRPKTGSLLRELGLPDSAFLCLTVGQIGLRKGQNVLAEAAVRLKDELPNVHYVLVGERHSTKRESIELERNVARRFEDAGMADRLHRLGSRGDVSRLMNEADLLVHPAHQEPLGRVLLEAAASGLPVIATDVGGTGEILRDGQSARLIPPNDAEALAAAIAELHANPDLRNQFAVAARAEIESRFSIETAAENLAAIWRAVVSESAQREGP